MTPLLFGYMLIVSSFIKDFIEKDKIVSGQQRLGCRVGMSPPLQ
jgi:hypothetical protein